MSVQMINPANGQPLRVDGDALVDDCGARFPIIDEIPRICEASNYTRSFGKQWNLFSRTQIDNAEQRQSATRFFAETGWARDALDGITVLEVGSGAGRFTRVVLEQTRADIVIHQPHGSAQLPETVEISDKSQVGTDD